MEARLRMPHAAPPTGAGVDRRSLVGGALGLLTWPRAAHAAAVTPRQVTFIAQDFRNGGITTVYRSFEQACQELGWSLNIVNGNGDRATIRRRFDEALLAGVDGIVLGGFDEADIAGAFGREKSRKPVLVGWHAAARSGPTPTLFSNVTSDPGVVAEMAVALVKPGRSGRAGVVIFNDSRFEIANVKTQRMREALSRCEHCELLAVEDLPISSASQGVSAALARLQAQWGERWTHVLAINDVYMDSMHFPLQALGRQDIVGIAAGDGSRAAHGRIRSGRSRQIAPIAEPTGQQGWQLADELRRAFSRQPPSARVWLPSPVTTDSLQRLAGRDIGDDSGSRSDYRRLWRGDAGAAQAVR